MATTEELLAEAKAALHRINTGTSAVEVHDRNGEKVSFSQINSSKLQAYIESLERQLSGQPALGPMRVYI